MPGELNWSQYKIHVVIVVTVVVAVAVIIWLLQLYL